MGKVKRARQKAHISAKIQSANTNKKTEDMPHVALEQCVPVKETVEANMFSGVDLTKYKLTGKLPEFDTCSTITSKSFKGLNMKKKDKRKLKHDLWMEKLNAVELAKKKAKEKLKLQQTPIIGDIRALGDALPTLDLILKKSTGPADNREVKKAKGIQTEKKRKKQMMENISIFQQVYGHPAFKDKPTDTISEHLHNRHKLEDMDT